VTDNRELSWDGCINVRDLGGLGRFRSGAVVRMEAPDRLSETGWTAAWAYGVRTIIDLRDPGEGAPDSAPRPAGITTVQVPLNPTGTPFYEHWKNIDNLASPLYYPALLALVLLTLAGATPEQIIDDYLLSYERMKQRYVELGIRDQLTAVREFLATRNTTIEASLTTTIASLAMPG
jgi:protein-tyrosine phosphatase